jgi:tetratricopeptide (TPR) repeat protein
MWRQAPSSRKGAMRTKIFLTLGTVAAVSVAVLFGGVLRSSGTSGQAAAQNRDEVAGRLLAGFAPGDTAAYVSQLEARVAAIPGDSKSFLLLGLAYQQRVRETGDPSFYPRSEAALRRALRLTPKNALAVTGLAALAASRHRFEEARALAERARRLAPASAGPLGVLGDAFVELGRYRQAFAAFNRMAALKPSLASYSRVSYARELLGDPRGAIVAMRLAVQAGEGTAEPAAWSLVQLGNLYFDTGRLAPAEHAYRAALTRFPGYVHAEAALGRVAAARGHFGAAAKLYRRAVERLPLPQYEGALGDVLHLAGRGAEAEAAFGTVGAIEQLLAANGVRTELETALFDLDHDRRLPDALARARVAYETRKSIEGEDVLAWALYKNGRCDEARSHSERALRLGTRDALKIFHRGMIEVCFGHRAAGRSFIRRALAINPQFSLIYGPVAREALR